VLLRESLFGTDTSRPVLDPQLAVFLEFIGDLVRAAQARGELRGGVDPAEACFAFFALYFAVLVGGLRGDLPAEAQAPLLARLVSAHFPAPEALL
jgi:hypothetical protein